VTPVKLHKLAAELQERLYRYSELQFWSPRGWIRTDDLPITRRMLGIDLDGSRWI
jgi:hypothetical protein